MARGLVGNSVNAKGYEPQKVTVIIQYSQQEEYLADLIDAQKLDRKGHPRLSTINRYQGGENDIVIVDLADVFTGPAFFTSM